MAKIHKKLTDAVPDIERYWDHSKNDGKTPADFSPSSSAKVWTRCPICGTSVLRNVRFTWAAGEDGVGHVIHCRTCGKRSSGNALVEQFPEIKNYWVYDKNEHDPEFYTISSGKRVFIRCPDCGIEREIAICDAVKMDSNGKYYLSSCPDCGTDKMVATKVNGGRDIETCVPDIDKYWGVQNTVSANSIAIRSIAKIYINCPGCGKSLYRDARNSFKQENGRWAIIKCQKCGASEANYNKGLNQSGSVIEECPEIAEWWDEPNNVMSINSVSRGSHYVASLKCPACHTTFKRDLHKFIAQRSDGRFLPVACPECGYSSEGDPVDNLLKDCPEIAEWWDYEKNAPFKPEQFTRGSNAKAYLKCPDCGLEMYSDIKSYTIPDDNGNYVIAHKGRCRKYRAMDSEYNLVKNYPEVKNWWDYEKNSSEIPEEYTLFSPKPMYFKCPDCGTVTHRRITDAFSINSDGIPTLFKCPYCNETKVTPGVNSVQDKYPSLVEEWSPRNERQPDKVLYNSSYNASWICPACNGEYSMRVQDRDPNGGRDDCPYCTGRKALEGYNSLIDTNPALANEWSLRNDRLPNQVLKSSSFNALWICPSCHGEYSMRVKDRDPNGGSDDCPYCNDKKPLKGYNTLADRYPEFVGEWSDIENYALDLEVDEVLPSSSKLAFWNCSICKHTYTKKITDYVLAKRRGHNPCPYCNGRIPRRYFY